MRQLEKKLINISKKFIVPFKPEQKSHTKLDKKEFLKGLDFIMNSTKFKFNGKFYKQKFGTPIGSVISLMVIIIMFCLIIERNMLIMTLTGTM